MLYFIWVMHFINEFIPLLSIQFLRWFRFFWWRDIAFIPFFPNFERGWTSRSFSSIFCSLVLFIMILSFIIIVTYFSRFIWTIISRISEDPLHQHVLIYVSIQISSQPFSLTSCWTMCLKDARTFSKHICRIIQIYYKFLYEFKFFF